MVGLQVGQQLRQVLPRMFANAQKQWHHGDGGDAACNELVGRGGEVGCADFQVGTFDWRLRRGRSNVEPRFRKRRW